MQHGIQKEMLEVWRVVPHSSRAASQPASNGKRVFFLLRRWLVSILLFQIHTGESNVYKRSEAEAAHLALDTLMRRFSKQQASKTTHCP